MNLAYFCYLGGSQRTGGGQRFARELLTIFKSQYGKKLIVVLYCYENDCDFAYRAKQDLESNGINVYILHLGKYRPGSIRTDITALLKGLSLLKKIDRDFYLMFDSPHILQRLFIHRKQFVMMHVPLNFVDRKITIKHLRSSIDLIWQNFTMRKFIKDILIGKRDITPFFNSKYTQNKMFSELQIADTAKDQNFVLGLPLDTRLFRKNDSARKDVRNTLRLKETDRLIISVSNFNSEIKQGFLYKRLINLFSNPNIKFLLIGKGGGKFGKEVDDIAAYDNVIRIGEIDMEDVLKYYSAADIFISLSNRETFGYTVLEAMYFELPTFVLNEAALPELFAPESYEFICSDVSDMHAKIEKFLTEKCKYDKGTILRENVEKRFSHEGYSRHLSKHLRK